MSKPKAVSALSNAYYKGYVEIKELGLLGMVSLRTELGGAELQTALKTLCGTDIPAPRQILKSKQIRVAWMSPDEVLIICPYGDAKILCAALTFALKLTHALVLNISDARAAFEINGAGSYEVLAKLCPVDLSFNAFQTDEIRRTRLAQIPAAFWLESDGCFHLICFRSVAEYTFKTLCLAARPGGEIF